MSMRYGPPSTTPLFTASYTNVPSHFKNPTTPTAIAHLRPSPHSPKSHSKQCEPNDKCPARYQLTAPKSPHPPTATTDNRDPRRCAAFPTTFTRGHVHLSPRCRCHMLPIPSHVHQLGRSQPREFIWEHWDVAKGHGPFASCRKGPGVRMKSLQRAYE